MNLVNEGDEKGSNKNELITQLMGLCILVDAEHLFISICHSDLRINNPCLIELLAFYAYPQFGTGDKLKPNYLSIKKCITLLKEAHASNNLTSSQNTSDFYIAGVRGLSYPHQVQDKIKGLGKNGKSIFKEKIGFPPERIAQIVKKIFIEGSENQQLIISKEQLARAIGCTDVEWQTLMDKFAISNTNFSKIRHIEDIRHYPIYSLSNDRIIILHPTHLLEVIWELFQEKIEKHELFEGYQKERSAYLVNRLARLLKKKFPKNMIKEKVFYPDPNKNRKGTAEVDMLLKYGNVLLAFEAKANRHFRPRPLERKGRNNFYPGYLRDALEHSAQQGNRFKEYFEKTNPSEASKTLDIDVSQVKKVIVLSIALDNLGDFGFNTELLKEEKIHLPETDYLSLCIDELEVILDHCKSPEMVIDYVLKRSEIKKSEKPVVSDELDVFGYYLNHGRLPSNINAQSTVYFGYSSMFDDYYNKKYLYED
jgi:hypothetical protein